jgi:hypothetical protein
MGCGADAVAKAGDRIRLIEMPNDPDPIEPGTTGTVTKVTPGIFGQPQIWVDWDVKRSLMLIEGVDRYEVLPKELCANQFDRPDEPWTYRCVREKGHDGDCDPQLRPPPH